MFTFLIGLLVETSNVTDAASLFCTSVVPESFKTYIKSVFKTYIKIAKFSDDRDDLGEGPSKFKVVPVP